MKDPPQTLYISGPITGVFNSDDAFGQVEKVLKADGYTVLNPMEISPPFFPDEKRDKLWVYYMKKAIPMLLEADCIYMLKGWETSKGARLEFWLATQLNITVHYDYAAQSHV